MSEEVKKPTYIDPGRCLTSDGPSVGPPFIFRDVSARVFPIKANMAHLEYFIDHYLNNDIPTQIAHFRPALPYVYLMILNYGSMVPATVQAQNIGWVAQHEVAFTVPLEWWYEDEKGQLAFKDWATVSPFIFVDDDLSLATGREVYGWPKVLANIHAETTLWTEDPRAPSRMFSLQTSLFPKAYAGARSEYRVLLQIDRDPAPDWTQFPPNPNNPWSPLSVLPNAAQAWLRLMADTFDMAAALPIRGYRSNRSPTALFSMYRKLGLNFTSLFPMFFWQNTATSLDQSADLSIQQITLKQFPRADKPSKACYQGLVASGMGIERLNQSGMLGDANLLRGDPSGGFTIRIYRYTGQPIVESLGLEVEREEEGDGAPVSIFKPTLPFWTDVDLYYGKGNVICSRTYPTLEERKEQGIWWVNEQVKPPHVVPPNKGTPIATDIPYNTARAAATQPVSGPFRFQNANVQVYPLLADEGRIRKLLNISLNEPLKLSGLQFKPFGAYVYLMVTGYIEENGKMYSEANNIGLWAGREVTFALPVKCYYQNDLISLALVSPYVYRSSGRAVVTDREVQGCTAIKATIESPPDAWLTDPGGCEGRRMLRVDTQVFPALYLGQRAEHHTLIEIDSKDILSDCDFAERAHIDTSWGEEFRKDQLRKNQIQKTPKQKNDVKNVRALALELLSGHSSLNWIFLKNYPDAQYPEQACYQALVKRTRNLKCIKEIEEIDQLIHVYIHKYQGHPIQETLGLKQKFLDLAGGTGREVFQAIHPFWMKVDIEEHLSDVICWRNKHDDWICNHPWFSSSKKSLPLNSSQLPYFLDSGTERVGREYVGRHPYEWPRLRVKTKEKGLKLTDAKKSIKDLNEVQVVVESLLNDCPRGHVHPTKRRSPKPQS